MKSCSLRIFIAIFIVLVSNNGHAQVPVAEVIKQAVVKVIKAVDLKIQRLQNETIWMQNAQKVVENTLTKLKLEEIAGWMDKQKQLYETYYGELWKVRDLVARYQRIKDIYDKHRMLINAYRQSLQLLSSPSMFTAQELEVMNKVYSGIFSEAKNTVELVLLVTKSLALQMTDEERLELLDMAAEELDQRYADLLQFNQQNLMLAQQREAELKDAGVLKQLYGF